MNHVFASAMQAVAALFLLFGTTAATGEWPVRDKTPAQPAKNDATVAYFMMRGF